MRVKLKNIFMDAVPQKTLYQVLFLILMILVANVGFLAQKSMLSVTLLLSAFSYMFLVLTKDLEVKEMNPAEKKKKQKRQFNIFGFTMVYALWESFNTMCLFIPFSAVRKILSLIMFFFCLIVGLILIYSKNMEVIDGFLEHNFYAGPDGIELEPGDIVIGDQIDPETHKPLGKRAVQFYKDRFVHTLILGPTGSGKTSQLLGPMSYQDIKNPNIGVIVLEPKGDFAELVYARALLEKRPAVVYFNPVLKDCPYFNPLMCSDGGEPEMIENICAAFAAMDTTSSSYFRDQNDGLLRNSLKAVKRLFGNDATFQDVIALMNNINGQGTRMMTELAEIKTSDPLIAKENDNIYNYFMNDYFSGLKGARGASKTYADSSAVRNQIQKLISNPYLARILNPQKTSELKPGEYLDFDRVLAEGEVLCMCSAQGALRDMGTYLGYFLILTLQSSVFKREGNEWSRKGCVLYIDEFQKYANNGFADMLTQGRSYRVASVLATQNRALINSGGDAGRQFLENVSTNCRNIILLPGMNSLDAKYYEAEFGTKIVEEEKISFSNRAYVPKFVGFDSARETTSTSEVEKPYFSATDLVYRPFGETICRFIDHNTVQKPLAVTVQFVDREIDEKASLARITHERMQQEKIASKISKEAEIALEESIRIQPSYDEDDEDDLLDLGLDNYIEPSFADFDEDDILDSSSSEENKSSLELDPMDEEFSIDTKDSDNFNVMSDEKPVKKETPPVQRNDRVLDLDDIIEEDDL